MTTVTKRGLMLGAVGALAAAMAPMAQAQQTPLAGETIRFVVGYGAGGGFDAYARMLAPELARRTGATVVVENRPGGGGQTATNQMTRETADGLTQYLLNGVPAVLGQIVRSPGMNYDLTEFTWLAGVNAETWAVMVNKDTPYHTVADLQDTSRPVVWAALSRADGPSDGAATLCEAINANCNIVLGFQGTSEASLAVIRGEAQAIVMTDTSVFNASQGEQARVIGVLGNRRSALFPDVPTVPEQVELDDDGMFWNNYRANIADIGRSIVAPPNMDPEMTAFLRGVWQEILTDPAVVAMGEQAGRVVEYVPGENLLEMINGVFGGDASSRAGEVEDVLLNRYFR